MGGPYSGHGEKWFANQPKYSEDYGIEPAVSYLFSIVFGLRRPHVLTCCIGT
jgi:hypothetical protein